MKPHDHQDEVAATRLIRNQRGISVLAIIFVILVLAAIGYTFSAMMAAKQKSVPATLDAGKAFYIAEGGLAYAGIYLSGQANWAPLSGTSLPVMNLGSGNFVVTFSGYLPGSPESIIAASTGTSGMGQRQLKATFQR